MKERSNPQLEQVTMLSDMRETMQTSEVELIAMQPDDQFQIVNRIKDDTVLVNMKMPTENSDQEVKTNF